jgi:hypothetical protein
VFVAATGSNQTARARSTATAFSFDAGNSVLTVTSTRARYADLAENYLADNDYEPGVVLMFGGKHEVTQAIDSHSGQIAGVVSTAPAHLMNGHLVGQHVAPVALLGRVPCKVVGNIVKGDRLAVSTIPGIAQRLDNDQYQPGCIIGKALEDYNSDVPGVIEIAVGRI